MSVTGTTNMKSNEVYEVGLFSFFFLVPNMVLANMNTVESVNTTTFGPWDLVVLTGWSY